MTLFSGRVLVTHSLSCCLTISSYCASVVTGALAHLHDLVAAGLQLAQQLRQRLGGCCWKSCIRMMPLPSLSSLAHHVDHLLRLAHLEVEGVEVAGEDRDVARAEIAQHLRRLLQIGEAEERRDGASAAIFTALKPFSISSLACSMIVGIGVLRQIVRPGVGADGHSGGENLLEDFRDDRSRACRSGRTSP